MDRRPDIYQVTSVACKLFGRRCSVGNLNKVGVPTIDQLIAGHFVVQPPLPAGAAVRPSSRPTAQSPQVDYSNDSIIVSPSETTNVATPRITTVAPRERPRAAQKTSVPLLQPTKVPESQSNPDLTGRNVEIPASRSVHSGIQKVAIESMPRPEELGFTELGMIMLGFPEYFCSGKGMPLSIDKKNQNISDKLKTDRSFPFANTDKPLI